MLNLTFKFKSVNISSARYKRDVSEALQDEVLTATRVALREIVKRIPVYTGEARGTLKPIGRFLNEEIPISPIAKRKGHTPTTGERQSSAELSLDSPLRPVVRIDIQLFHVRWNEFNEAPFPTTNPTPWHAFEAGRKAFVNHMKANLKKKIPRISDYLTKATLKGDPNGG